MLFVVVVAVAVAVVAVVVVFVLVVVIVAVVVAVVAAVVGCSSFPSCLFVQLLIYWPDIRDTFLGPCRGPLKKRLLADSIPPPQKKMYLAISILSW